ncbi:MAG: N-acetylmuramoyl-L-alanine amidase [Pseudomonadales bacterium]|nr:N-acetylmuramoyl-L-alanine amidase [Pseudomonadales bacterium]
MPNAVELVTNPTIVDVLIYTLTVAAGLSLVIERILEIFKHFTDFESKRGEEGSRTEKVKKAVKDAYNTSKSLRAALKNYQNDKDIDAFVASVSTPDQAALTTESFPDAPEMESDGDEKFEQNNAIKVLPLTEGSATQIRQRAFLQLAAAGLGVMAAEAFDLRMLVLFFENFNQYTLIDTIVTGIVIGGGSQPIHVLIRFLTTRRMTLEEEKETIKEATPKAATETFTPIAPPAAFLSFEYQGGVDSDKLENRNHRPHNPNKIVYHHTAMHHENSFQAVVEEFTVVKKWSTGYHCVIMPSGKVEFFCRWDRVGNHAYGVNPESLGIAFHGNFHTKGNDQFSNAQGLFGNQSPTPAQIKAGAEVIALWAHVYDIPLDFNNDIVPHYMVKPTACPGSNFPHKDLQPAIEKAYARLQTAQGEQAINDIKQLPFVYV